MAIHRAGIWGLAAAGDAAVPGLLSMLEDDDVGIVQRAAHALSEAAEHPDASVVKVRCAETRSDIPARSKEHCDTVLAWRQALGGAMDKLRATIDLESEGLTLDEVSPTRRLDLAR